ncbi:uncharacterized protein LOC122011746 [Zingiber officinale]|uniref:uncharacterized protein LOC122011746 n=1 Tax=Zingiber officinale TaxID=94328 RepID=UPI001C4B4732|nr:uncharacterized protein LOC122011746 [Zingiber officinale]XP_042424057.1 uncharacterized protein LOC122011746 [Zingiber officinale]XP_042424058.1 uncharacterized protein LOC122011746 [Zingiber officinale]
MSEEAAERITISLTPELAKRKSSVEKNSTVKIGKGGSTSEERPAPHYLRASTTSCHHFCKYGVKHDFEVKKRHPVRKRFLANKDMFIDEKDEVLVANKLERGMKDYSELPPEKIIQISEFPTEKIIQLPDSPTNPEDVSVQDSIVREFGFPSSGKKTDSLVGHVPPNQNDRSSEETTSIHLLTPPSVSTSNVSDQSPNMPEGLPLKPISINLEQKAIENVIAFSEIEPTEGLSAEPVVIKLIVSSLTGHSNTSVAHTTSNQPERICEEPLKEDSSATFPIQENTASSEHTTFSEPDALSVEVPSMKPKNHKDARSAQKELANSGMTQKATPSTASKRGKKANPSLAAEANGDTTELKIENENVGTQERTEVIWHAKVMVSGTSNGNGKNPSSVRRKMVISSMADTKQMSNRNLESEITRTAKKRTSSASKTTNASAEATNPMKAKDLSLKAMCQSPSSEKHKISNISSHSGKGANSILAQSLSSLSVRSLTSEVSKKTIYKHRNIIPVPQVKIEKGAGRPRVESNESSGPKPESINLRSVKQHVMKHGEVNKSTGKDGYPRGISTVFSKNQIGKPYGRTASVPSDKSSTRHKLKFSGTKVVSLQSDKNAPRILRFRPAKIASDKQNAKEDVKAKFTVISKGQIDRQHRRTVSLHSEDKFSSPQKLKFSRGKVTSLQPEINASSILRFRRRKLASDNQNDQGDFNAKFCRSGRSISNSNTPIAKALTIVLRHQDVQEKKDTQGLLNQVIEETASKLVETRKSKVKALVGAFETVISLQEGKASPLPDPSTPLDS